MLRNVQRGNMIYKQIRLVGPGHWLVDHADGVQSEVRALEEGGFSILQTNGVSTFTGSAPDWQTLVDERF